MKELNENNFSLTIDYYFFTLKNEEILVSYTDDLENVLCSLPLAPCEMNEESFLKKCRDFY